MPLDGSVVTDAGLSHNFQSPLRPVSPSNGFAPSQAEGYTPPEAMNKRRIIWIAVACPAIFFLAVGFVLQLRMPAYRLYHGPPGDQAGLDSLRPPISDAIDARVRQTLPNYEYISVGLVRDGNVVFIKSYGRQRVDRRDVYASVSKPVTAMIVFQLLEGGRMSSLDDDIGEYCDRYRNCLPDEFAGNPITFRHLLSHRSGVPHLSRLWRGDTLDLEFRPGERVKYSSHAFGILGEVLEAITGKSYSRLVRQRIGAPVGAYSMTVMIPSFDAPAGQVGSTIGDMARFGQGVMAGTYISTNLLCEEVLKKHGKDRYGAIGLGWYCARSGEPDVSGYHAGSNGRPRAFLAIKPSRQAAVALMGLSHSEDGPHDFGQLAVDLMALLEDERGIGHAGGFSTPVPKEVDWSIPLISLGNGHQSRPL